MDNIFSLNLEIISKFQIYIYKKKESEPAFFLCTRYQRMLLGQNMV